MFDIIADNFNEAATFLEDASLEELMIANANQPISQSALEKFTQNLETYQSLKSLWLTKAAMEDAHFCRFVQAWAANKNLGELTIEYCNLTLAQLQQIATALQSNSSLKNLGLINNGITDDKIITVINACHDAPIQECNLLMNQLSDGSAKAIAHWIEKSNTLTTIWLDRNQITDEGAKFLLAAVAKNKAISSLSLSGNSLTDAVVIDLIAMLPKFKDHPKLVIDLEEITISPLPEIKLRKQLLLYPHLKVNTIRFPVNHTTISQYTGIKNTDSINRPVALNLIEPSPEDKLALKVLHRWRQIFRARTLHRRPTLFDANAYNSLNNRATIPREFRHLAQKVEPLFTKVTHYSSHLLSILHDGVIYSKFQATHCGIGEKNDSNRLDDLLVFTSPHCHYKSDNYISLSVNKLFLFNDEKGVYCRFFDLAFDKNEYSKLTLNKGELVPATAQVTEDVILKVHLEFPNFIFEFYDKNDQRLAQVKVSGERLMYHGMKGLDEYYTFLIFFLLKELEKNHGDLKEAIYDSFRELDEKNLLATHLHMIATSLLRYAELNYINRLRIDFRAIESVKYKDQLFDFNELRKIIEQDKVEIFTEKFLLNAVFYDELIQCMPLVKGIFDYAKQYGANNILARFVDFCPIYEQGYFQATHNLDANDAPITSELIYTYNNFLSLPYADAALFPAEAQLMVDGKVLYRPNHALAHIRRQMLYIPHIVAYLAEHANNAELRAYCCQFSLENEIKLKRIVMFLVAGRGSEISFSDHYASDQFYHACSAEKFAATATKFNWLSPDEIVNAKIIIRYLGNPDYPEAFETNSPHFNFEFYILNLAHRFDLMRCYTAEQYERSINKIMSKLVIESAEQQEGLNHLFSIVNKAMIATGERQFCHYQDGKIVDQYKEYTQPLFYKANTDVRFCDQALQVFEYTSTVAPCLSSLSP